MMAQIQKIIDPLRRRVMNMVARGIVNITTDSGQIQRLQVNVLADEVLDQLERIQEYGHFSVPKSGSECVIVFLGGNRDHGVVIATDDRRTRPTGNGAGDTGLWTTSGALLALRDGSKNLEVTGIEKFKVDNGTAELMATLSELLQFLINARTTTAVGPQPLFDITGADTLPAIKTKIDSFKV